jgi:recombination protein RecA
MSSAVVSTSAALGRPFVFDDETVPEVSSPADSHREGQAEVQESPIARILQSAIKNQQSKIPPARVTPASQLDIRPAPEMVTSGIPAIDALTGGLPRGCLTEICGPASSGRTTVLLAALAAATRRGEFCAVVDASDALDPHSAAAAGVELDRLLWVRCGENPPKLHTRQNDCLISGASFTGKAGESTGKIGTREACPELAEQEGVSSQAAFNFDRTGSKENRLQGNVVKKMELENGAHQSEHRLEQVLRATDLLLESGGFGLIALDLGDLPPQAARRIPLTTWFRFRRAVEPTPTILLAIEPHPIAGSCSSLLLQLGLSSIGQSNHGMLPADESAAEDVEAPERQKKITLFAQSELDLPYPAHAQLFTGLNITAELIRSRLDRKPARSVAFVTKTAWAG